mgnify:CR=1 FL=1
MEIWHDPYVLLALISARIGGEWTVDTAMPTLELLFEQQYKLTTYGREGNAIPHGMEEGI